MGRKSLQTSLTKMAATEKGLKTKTQNDGKSTKLDEKIGKKSSGEKRNDDYLYCPFCGSLTNWWRGAPFCTRCGWREGCCD
ncbi:MAG: hypothetical protein NZ805_04340 [Armatimonadetes bacterium]|nr:hypothetical protein [Armatimonadota bacterium]MDW8027301.1 hypothetical protein [Armatimonadota bacterium]